MKRPLWWKRWLSHLFPLVVETVESTISGQLTVVLASGEYRLDTEHSVYSHGRQYPPFSAGLSVTGFPPQESKVLLLGTGLGSGVDILKDSGQAYHITAVDIDPVVLALAEHYLELPRGWSMRYVCADAAEWVREAEGGYSLIFADIFIHNDTPTFVGTHEFLQHLHRLLAPGGVLIFSRLYDSEEVRRDCDAFEQGFSQLFPGYRVERTGGNKVFVFLKED